MSTEAAIAEAFRALRFTLTEDDFPFYNRYPRRTDRGTIAMWAERDVLDLIDSVIAEMEAAVAR